MPGQGRWLQVTIVDQNGKPATGTAVVGFGSSLSPSKPTTVNAGKCTSGGTSQVLFTAGEVVHGCVISNGLSATDEGAIAAAEEIWVDFTGAAAAANGNSGAISVQPGQSIAFTGGLATSVNWLAATTNHTISAYKF